MSITPGFWYLSPSGEANIIGTYTVFHDRGGTNFTSPYNQICAADNKDDARAIAAIPDFLSLARRVHAECGMEFVPFGDGSHYRCKSCGHEKPARISNDHKPDCLWLAADALLRKVGEL